MNLINKALKNLIYTFVLLCLVSCGENNIDTSDFEQMIIGCWDFGQNHYRCFDKHNSTVYRITSSGETKADPTNEYIVYSEKNNICIKIMLGSFTDISGQKIQDIYEIWTVNSYSQNSLSIELCSGIPAQSGVPDSNCNSYKLTRRE